MADKATEHHRSDQELVTLQSAELRRKKRTKLAIYISAFVVVQIIVITVLALTVLRVKSPKVRLRAIDVQTLNAAPAIPSFNASFTAQIRVKNTNFGRYKFDASTAKFDFDGKTVGQVSIPKSKVGMRSTKTIDVTVSFNSKGLPRSSNPGIRDELSTGVLRLVSEIRLTGKVEMMLVMKKKKSAKMTCPMEFNLSTKQIQYLQCW